MANFKISYELLKRWENIETKEGLIVYSNHKLDKGGETVLGVARKIHPNLSIWEEVDKLTKKYLQNGTKKDLILLSNKILENENITKVVEYFFENNYWKKLKCDFIEHQDFASNIFLLGVNAGVKRAIKVGQQSCNIAIDGIIGKQTINAWKTAGDKECKKFTEIEIKYYKSLVDKDKSQEVFLKGWINRANTI